MIRLEAIKPFTLERFNELTNIVRKGVDLKGQLNAGDTFECPKDLAEYLMGKNDKGIIVATPIEIMPDSEPKEKVTKKKSSKK